MKLAAQRELQREGINRHSSWLSVFRDRLGRASTAGEDGLPYVYGGADRDSRDKENNVQRPSASAEGGAKMKLGDGKSIVIRIESQ